MVFACLRPSAQDRTGIQYTGHTRLSIMTHIWYQAENIPSRITDHMFQRTPRQGFDVWLNGIPTEDHRENILNPFTVWNQNANSKHEELLV